MKSIGTNNIFIKTDADGKSKTISINSGETKYSDQINVSSEKDFARVGFRSQHTGTCNLDIFVEYTFPGDTNYSDGKKLGDIDATNVTKITFFRLDAILGPDWMPNTPFRFKFVASGGGSAIIEGIYSV